MSALEIIIVILFGIALTGFSIAAAMNAKEGKAIWVFVAPPVWLFRPEWFNVTGNRYRKICAGLWLGILVLILLIRA